MTSNECEVGKVSSSKVGGNANRVPYKAFDGNYALGDTTQLNNSWQPDDNNEHYIQFEFNNPVIVNRLELVPYYSTTYGGLNLKNVKLLLSNDGENFKEASELITYPNNKEVASKWQVIYSNDTENAYKFVRLYTKGTYTTSYGEPIIIQEIQIYGCTE